MHSSYAGDFVQTFIIFVVLVFIILAKQAHLGSLDSEGAVAMLVNEINVLVVYTTIHL